MTNLENMLLYVGWPILVTAVFIFLVYKSNDMIGVIRRCWRNCPPRQRILIATAILGASIYCVGIYADMDRDWYYGRVNIVPITFVIIGIYACGYFGCRMLLKDAKSTIVSHIVAACIAAAAAFTVSTYRTQEYREFLHNFSWAYTIGTIAIAYVFVRLVRIGSERKREDVDQHVRDPEFLCDPSSDSEGMISRSPSFEDRLVSWLERNAPKR